MSLLRKLLAENSVKPSVITYTTTDGNIITPHDGVFLDAGGNQCKLVSNTYENGQGIMTFDRAIYSVNYYDNNQWSTLKTIALDDAIKVLNNLAFYWANKLEKIQLSNNLNSLLGSCFGGCHLLKELILPKSVNYIVNGSILDGINIPKIEIIENDTYKSEGNCIIRKNDNALIVGCAKSIIPDYVESIKSNTFVFQEFLYSINIGKNINQINNGAFRGCCLRLASITVDDDNPYFYVDGNCLIRKADKTIIISAENPMIPEGIEILGFFSFCSNNLEKIEIPSSIKRIEQYAFYTCGKLKTILSYNKIPPSGQAYIFNNINKNAKIYVPDSSLEAYKTADGWSAYADKIHLMSEYQE